MNRRIVLALCGATLACAVAAVPSVAVAAGSPAITIRIEGKKKTLLLPTVAHGHAGFITRFNAPPTGCPAQSAMGAFDTLTGHDWVGSWFASPPDYFVSSILGESYAKSKTYFWEIFVNNVAASTGACEVKLRRGEQVLFAAETGAKNPSGLKAPRSAVAGRTFSAKVVGYTAKGKAVPLRGVLVRGNGITATRTNRHGIVKIRDRHPGVLVLRTSPRRYVRSEAIVHVAA